MDNQALVMFNSTIKYSGHSIFIKPFCDFFGIEYDNQCRRINSSHLLKTSAGKNPSKLLFGDERERLTLTKQGFITWILQLNPQIVHVSLREKLIQYQTLIFDYMFGSMEREDKAKAEYTRLNKLKRLRAKINVEIAQREVNIKRYLTVRFIQATLPFPGDDQDKSIEENNPS